MATKKDKKKLLKIIIAAAVVIIIGVALVVVLNLPDSADDSSSQTSTQEAKITDTVDDNNLHQAEPDVDEKGEVKENGSGELISYIPRNIKTIKVKNTKGSFTINSYTPVEKTTDSDGNEVTETQATEYTLVGYEDKSIAAGKPDAVASDASTMEFTKIVSVSGDEDSDFGFDNPRATVTVTYQDKTSSKFYVGDVAPNDTGVYVKFGTGKAIYLVEEDAVDSFLYSIYDFIALEVTDSASDGDTATPKSVHLSGTLYKEDIEFGECTDETAITNYLITEPKTYYGNDIACSEIEAGIRGISADSVVCINPTSADLEKYGLATPYAVLSATYSDKTYDLQASKPDSKEYCYLMVKNGDVIYKILSDSIKWTQSSLDELRSDYFVDNEITALSKTEVSFDKNNYTFDLTTKKTTTTDSDGNDQTSTDTTVKYNGKEISFGSFQTAFDFMHGATFTRSEFTNEKISGKPDMTIKFTYSADTGRATDTLELYEISGKKYIGVVNGEQISYVYKTAVTDLQKLFTSATKSSPSDDEN